MKQGLGSMTPGRRKLLFFCLILLAVTAVLMVVLPTVRRGLAVLCNELFTASEAVNQYAYEKIPVEGMADPDYARALLITCGILWIGVLGLLPGCGMILFSGMVLALGQTWFGLSLPVALNCGIYGGMGLLVILKRNGIRACLPFCVCVILSVILVTAVLPGSQPSVEEWSERVRDLLEPSPVSDLSYGVSEEPEQRETRYENLKDLQEGNESAETHSDYRLVTVEEEQIALPHWIDYLRIALLCILVPVFLALPFIPFARLNRRNRIIAEKLARTESEDPTEASVGMFDLVTGYLDAMKIGAPNSLYADRLQQKDDRISPEYAECYGKCTEIWLGAVYGKKNVTPEQCALFADLLAKTEQQFYDQGDRRTRFLLKYRYCLHE